ncbi:unnamed protein product [marine sediment metagenome]|uniref:Uncharacterized protein n=1 Tax=marine sediment metagenome TaxID=412755 RepID=X1CQH0_9ZZZZ
MERMRFINNKAKIFNALDEKDIKVKVINIIYDYLFEDFLFP